MSNQKLAYTIIAYPESMVTGWKMLLYELPFGYCYSTHDKDIDKKTGKIKKPHIHFFFQGVPTKKQKEYISKALGVGYQGQDVRTYSGMYDYLTHENDPDKYHYSKDSIRYSEKWNQEQFETSYEPPKEDLLNSLFAYIKNNHITEYSDLVDKLREEGRKDLLRASESYSIIKYIDSRRNSIVRELDRQRKEIKE